MKISINAEILDQLVAKIDDALGQKIYQFIGQKVKTDLLLGFRGSYAPDKTPWKKLSKSSTRGRDNSSKILVDTGNLRKSLNYKATSHGVKVGYGVKYAQKHQDGLGVPQRKILPTDESEIDMEAIEKMIKDMIDGI